VSSLLVDTCAAIWLANGLSVRQATLDAVDDALRDGIPIYVSPISAWEIGMLASKKRVTLSVTPERWFGRLLALPGFELTELSTEVLIASSFLPGSPPRDPADRIIAATARDLGATLLTRDRLLLAYAEQGHLSAVAC
jgi:PIN domain nuclease of toxin-antitoxin system